ncbi:MAG: Eco57I restriction-modification methylase domain-containing protein, partial [Fusobacterium sp.]
MGISNYKVYTPLKYADIITELAIKNYFRSEYTEKKLENLRAADLSCGTGNLLIVMLVKLIELSKKITGKYFFNPDWLRGYDIDENALEIYKEEGKNILKRYNLQGEIYTFLGDSLLEENLEKYNIVLGNPPYLGEKNHQEIFRKIKETEFGKKYYEAKMDYFYFFIEKGIDILENGGILVYVTTNYWLKADSGKILREKLKSEGHYT